MFILYADKNKLTVRKREAVTSGSVNACTVRFEFSPDWEGLERTAVFRAGAESHSILLDSTNECAVPWEVLAKPDVRLEAEVYGTRGGDTVLPTVWAQLGTILRGVPVPDGQYPPTPKLWQQALDGKQDKLHGLPGQVVGFDESGNAVPVDMPSGSVGEGGGAAYEFGHGLKQTGHVVSVDAVDDFTGDSTLPMTAAGVQAVVGNIDVLLGTI